MTRLPDDLDSLDAKRLASETATRDEQLAPLFRRWPRLSRPETTEMKRLWNERMRLARYVGRRRSRRR
jgi:hypothetical protein